MKFNKKLQLNKETIAELDNMEQIYGGAEQGGQNKDNNGVQNNTFWITLSCACTITYVGATCLGTSCGDPCTSPTPHS